MDIKKSLNRWFAGRKQKNEVMAQESSQAAALAQAPPAEAVEPEIVAVIATVLAVEMKMFMALQGRSFTFKQNNQPQGWSELGRLLVRPYQGVR